MPDFEKLNGKSIEEAFEDYLKANPHVYELFERLAIGWINDLRNAGVPYNKVRISSKDIIHQIRWHHRIEVHTKDWKINDAFSPCFARLFLEKNPKYKYMLNGIEKTVFELRQIRRNPILEFNTKTNALRRTNL